MAYSLVFDPFIPWPALFLLLAAAAVVIAWAALSSLGGWIFRAGAAAILAFALANPSLHRELREAEPSIVLAVVDRTASQTLGNRKELLDFALARLRSDIDALEGFELREVAVGDQSGAGDPGTMVKTALKIELSQTDSERIAGIILLTDGRIHDEDVEISVTAPVHALLTGSKSDADRRLVIEDAPKFGVVGQPVNITARVVDNYGDDTRVVATALRVSVNGGERTRHVILPGGEMTFETEIRKRGQNVIHIEASDIDGELTEINNSATVSINGVRDRLKVLLVSGLPHAGLRTWRNILKSDETVDLVHFTILRPVDKQQNVPSDESALIAFPARELFLEKVRDFDLIIFDRYRRQNYLIPAYFNSILQYVEFGGGLLIAAGPEFADPLGLSSTALNALIPVSASGQIFEQGYRPAITSLGTLHPVTSGLAGRGGNLDDQLETPEWGRWFRHIDVETRQGNVLMTGFEERPLLILDTFGEGRVVMLASDHAWLWHRQFEGGGPQTELLRRLAHWVMKEPDLEEEALSVASAGTVLEISRRTLGGFDGDLLVEFPDGGRTIVTAEEVEPGLYKARLEKSQTGMYRVSDGDLVAVAPIGPASPREFANPVSRGSALLPMVEPAGGGMFWIEEGMPNVRSVREGRTVSGTGWLGLFDRGSYRVTGIELQSLANALLLVSLALAAISLSWWREGK